MGIRDDGVRGVERRRVRRAGRLLGNERYVCPDVGAADADVRARERRLRWPSLLLWRELGVRADVRERRRLPSRVGCMRRRRVVQRNGPSCPPNNVEGAGTVCRASIATCDPSESCDGTSTACPSDVSACMSTDMGVTRDAGPTMHDAGASDAGDAAADATSGDARASAVDGGGTPPPAASGCGCRAGAGGRSMAWLLGLALVLARRLTRRR